MISEHVWEIVRLLVECGLAWRCINVMRGRLDDHETRLDKLEARPAGGTK